MSNMTQPGFWNRFKKAVPNFDETKCWLEKKAGKLFINFIKDGSLKRCEVYKYQYYIDLWKQHFIEYFETGDFDFNGYYIVYDKKDINPVDIGRVWKFPLISKFGNDCYGHSNESSKFLENYRQDYKNCGMKMIGKPVDYNKSEDKIFNINENLY